MDRQDFVPGPAGPYQAGVSRQVAVRCIMQLARDNPGSGLFRLIDRPVRMQGQPRHGRKRRPAGEGSQQRGELSWEGRRGCFAFRSAQQSFGCL